ncbi:TPA: type I restriction endonuclease subunit R [Streptococcus suis]
MEDKEIRFEADIETWLTSPQGGWTKLAFTDSNYDASKGLDLEALLSYIQETQPKTWARYLKMLAGADPASSFYKRFEQAVDQHGILHVLRKGFKDRGCEFKVIHFQPSSRLNQELVASYEINRTTLTRQFAFSQHNHKTLDMVLSVNGIPLVAIELKNQLKGQSVDHAKNQFKFERDPKELVFQFNRRFLVYFAVDLYEAWMTTRLDGEKTFFLPFNQGSNGAGQVGGAGNPANPEGYATSYLWEKVLQKDALMNLLQHFINLDTKEERDASGKKMVKQTLIFPRYHQLDVVRKLVADTQENGSGQHYLIQHSAGSGKSNSIAWLAYHLQRIHGEDDRPLFTSVIIVTDRTVLDRQLQGTITSFDAKAGLVETIDDKKSSIDLLRAINDGRQIIITTLQKFPVIYQEVAEASGKRFAVIVDEAHSSQTGMAAQKLKVALADKKEVLKEWETFDQDEAEKVRDDQDQLNGILLSQGRHHNISFYAFTATPKSKTMEMFGRQTEDGTFIPFHVYSMHQAIEEGFIHDVLKNYMTYHAAYQIAKKVEEDPELPPSLAKRVITRYAELHPYNIAQKTEIMVEMFRERTRHAIGGRGKAMVVTSSRLAAVRYLKEFKRYIASKGYGDMDVLVAFSGEVVDGDEVYTEVKLNVQPDGQHVKENQLKETFHGPAFHILIVAEKYQTGFDEPLLHTMFVDKKLRGVKAVQTLSRLNRTTAKKTDTFVLDFKNTAEEIQEAFQPFFESSSLDQAIDPNMLYDAKDRLRKYLVYNDQDVEKILALYRKADDRQDERLLGQFTSAFRPVIERYGQLEESVQYEFRTLLRGFKDKYNYISQLIRLFDMDLLEESVFITNLISLLPKEGAGFVDIEDKVRLDYYKLQQDFEGAIKLVSEGVPIYTQQKGINPAVKTPEETDSLTAIIERINSQFPDVFTDKDRVAIFSAIRDATINNPDEKQRAMARGNDFAMFSKSLFPREFEDRIIELSQTSNIVFDLILQNNKLYETLQTIFAEEAYKAWRKEESLG